MSRFASVQRTDFAILSWKIPDSIWYSSTGRANNLIIERFDFIFVMVNDMLYDFTKKMDCCHVGCSQLLLLTANNPHDTSGHGAGLLPVGPAAATPE